MAKKAGSKMGAMREALAAVGSDDNDAIKAHLKKAGVVLTDGMFSNYKSTILKKGRSKKAATPEPLPPFTPAVRSPVSSANSGNSFNAAELQAVAQLASKIGGRKIETILGALKALDVLIDPNERVRR